MIDDLFLSFGRTRGEIDRFGRSVSRRSAPRNNGSGVERKIRAVVWIRPASFLGFFPDNLRKYKGSLGGTGGSTLLSPSCQQINVLGLQKRAVGRDFRRGPTNTFLKFTLNLETPRTYVSSRAENTRMGRMDDKHRGKISVDWENDWESLVSIITSDRWILRRSQLTCRKTDNFLTTGEYHSSRV